MWVDYDVPKFKMAVTAGLSLTNVQMPSSHKLQIWLKPNCTWMFMKMAIGRNFSMSGINSGHYYL
jgi:hypothetical protein